MIIDWLISRMWRLMMQWSARLLGQPQVERFRVSIPYSVLCGLRVALVEMPAFALLLVAQALGYRGTAEISLARTWLTLGALPIGFGSLIALLTEIAYLSGYRPFRHRWEDVTPAEALRICGRLRSVAEGQRLKCVWSDPACGSFVAVGQMNRREEMYLSVLNSASPVGRRNVEMKLANRTGITWGRRGIRETGTRISSEAKTE